MSDNKNFKIKRKLYGDLRTNLSYRTRIAVVCSALLFVVTTLFIYSQLGINTQTKAAGNGDYRTIASGNWSNAAIWQTFVGGVWSTASSAPTSTNSDIAICTGHTVTVMASVTVDQLTVDAGGTLVINTGTMTLSNGANTDMVINGTLDIVSTLSASASSRIDLNSQATLRSTGTLTLNTGTTFAIGAGNFKREGGTMTTTLGLWTINSGGTFEHAMNGGALPLMTWTAGSNCLISGITITLPTNINQSFRNITWNCPNQSAAFDNTTNLKTILGNFTIKSTGTGILFFDQQGNNLIMNVGGNFTVEGGTTYLCENGADILNVSGNLVVTGGLFSFCKAGATAYGNISGTVNITGNLTVTGGTIDMSQYTANNAGKGYGVINLIGNLNVSGSGIITETQNSRGQIYFAGTAIQTYSINNSITNSIDYIVNSGATVRCNTLILNSGGDFTLMAGGHLMMGSPDGITRTSLTGNVQVTGTRSYSTGADYTYEGTDVQSSGDGLPSQVRNLTLNNAANCTLTNSSAASGTLTFTVGNWIATNDTLTLGISTATLGTLSRVTGHVVGYFRRWIANTTASNILFPIGTLSYYDGANFSFTTAPTAGSIVSWFSAVNPGNQGLPVLDAGDNCYNVGRGYWQFGAMNGFANGVYSVNLYANGFPGIEDYSRLHLMKRTGSGTNWTFNGTHAAGTGDNTSPIVNRTAMTQLGHYGITAGPGNALPIELTKFEVIAKDKVVNINWTTSSEKNNDYFTIERSGNGRDFEPIEKIDGAGNSNKTLNYHTSDVRPLTGKSYYRLKQTDFNGYFSYSSIRAVDMNAKPATISDNVKIKSVAPNPFNNQFSITYNLASAGETDIMLISINGQIMFTKKVHAEAGTNHFDYTDENNIPSGNYIITIISGGKKASQKIIKSTN